MLNIITIQGRLVKPVEMRYTQAQKPVASFTLAVERDIKKDADFIDCVAFGNTATFCEKYMDKGSMYIVSGRLQSREWTDKNDNKRKSWDVLADHVYFCDSKKADKPEVFTDISDDNGGELPF